jgi:hypothetical protein
METMASCARSEDVERLHRAVLKGISILDVRVVDGIVSSMDGLFM